MTLNQLRYFVAAARELHFGRAATSLHVTPSAVSHAVSALEEEFGHALFMRQGKRVVLTDTGRALVAHATHLLEQARQLCEEFSLSPSRIEGNYHLGGTHALCANVLTPAWLETTAQFPKVSGEILSLRSAQILQGVVHGELDMGLCFSPQPHPQVVIVPVHEGNLLPSVGKANPIAAMPAKKAMKILATTDAAFAKAFHGIDLCDRHPVLEKYGLNGNVRHLYDSYDTAIAMLQHSSAWTLLPDWVLHTHPSKVAPIKTPRDWPARYTIAVVRSTTSHESLPLKTLVQHIRRRF